MTNAWQTAALPTLASETISYSFDSVGIENMTTLTRQDLNFGQGKTTRQETANHLPFSCCSCLDKIKLIYLAIQFDFGYELIPHSHMLNSGYRLHWPIRHSIIHIRGLLYFCKFSLCCLWAYRATLNCWVIALSLVVLCQVGTRKPEMHGDLIIQLILLFQWLRTSCVSSWRSLFILSCMSVKFIPREYFRRERNTMYLCRYRWIYV